MIDSIDGHDKLVWMYRGNRQRIEYDSWGQLYVLAESVGLVTEGMCVIELIETEENPTVDRKVYIDRLLEDQFVRAMELTEAL